MAVKVMEESSVGRLAVHKLAEDIRPFVTKIEHPHRQELLQVRLACYRLANYDDDPKQSVQTIRKYLENHPEDALPAVKLYAEDYSGILDSIMAQESKPAHAITLTEEDRQALEAEESEADKPYVRAAKPGSLSR